MVKKKIMIVFGTRPEAIKMAPIIHELEKHTEKFETKIIVTAQHREMLDQVLQVFKITPDYDLNIMKKNQTLSEITAVALKKIENILIDEKPEMMLVHGDTTTSLAATLAAYYQQIPIGHVEAGLRTYDKHNPFPEEGNRQLIDTLADLFFVPTEEAKSNLLSENKNVDNIYVTGNTVIDAVFYTKSAPTSHPILDLMNTKKEKKWILLTMHRRENLGEPMKNVFNAIVELVNSNPDIEIVMPIHLNPIVQNAVKETLGNHANIHLIEPLEVDVFHKVMSKVTLVLTDSGGLQEEAPALNIPVLVLRDKTERPEGIKAGTLKLIGTGKTNVIKEVNDVLNNKETYEKMSKSINPYGDGLASKRIINELINYFNNV